MRYPAAVRPSIQKVWADQGFAGRLVDWSASILGRDLEIIRKAPDQRGFQVQPKRWAAERTFAWMTAHRRLARDCETDPARSDTMIRWVMIGIMLRPHPRLAGQTARTTTSSVDSPVGDDRHCNASGILDGAYESLDLASQVWREVGEAADDEGQLPCKLRMSAPDR